MMCVKGSTATELKSIGSAAQKYLDVQIPLIRCLSTFVFWAEVMSSREREPSKERFHFSPSKE